MAAVAGLLGGSNISGSLSAGKKGGAMVSGGAKVAAKKTIG